LALRDAQWPRHEFSPLRRRVGSKSSNRLKSPLKSPQMRESDEMDSKFRLGDFEVDPLARQLLREGRVVPLQQKPIQLLLFLLQNAGRVVTKSEIMEAVWPQFFVEEGNLTQTISVLRKALGEQAGNARYIVTVPGSGYQLGVAPKLIPAEPDRKVPEAPGPHLRSRLITVAVCTAVVLFLAGVAVAAWELRTRNVWAEATVRPLTDTGDVRLCAISPDGRLLAMAQVNPDGSQRLARLDVKTGVTRTLLNQPGLSFADLVVSPDNQWIYFRTLLDPAKQLWALDRIPASGGEAATVVTDVDGQATFLPGGRRVCFMRLQEGKFVFLSAAAEGGAETVLAQGGEPLPTLGACSPDGRSAVLAGEEGGVTVLSFDSGKRSPLYEPKGLELFTSLIWTPGGAGIVGTVMPTVGSAVPLRYIAWPSGRTSLISHDADIYSAPSITQAGEQMSAVRQVSSSEFATIDSSNWTVLQRGPVPIDQFFAWDSDQALLSSGINGVIKRNDLPAGGTRPVMYAQGYGFLQPNRCGPEAYVASGGPLDRRKLTVWYMRRDGSGLRELSHGEEDLLPSCTPDGQWVLYGDNHDNTLWRVRVASGSPERTGYGIWNAISPDGATLVASAPPPERGLQLISTATWQPLRTIDLPPALLNHRSLAFTHGGESVSLLVPGVHGVSTTVWEQPLSGSAPFERLSYPGYPAAMMQQSPDGSRLGLLLVKVRADALLLSTQVTR
jgi:DNA-binding winged helix-turn-helix (wHTH) protein